MNRERYGERAEAKYRKFRKDKVRAEMRDREIKEFMGGGAGERWGERKITHLEKLSEQSYARKRSRKKNERGIKILQTYSHNTSFYGKLKYMH